MTSAVRLIDRVDVLQQLLAAVAAVPAGVKLSIPALRDALVSQADVLDGLQTLVLAGELDQATLRPIEPSLIASRRFPVEEIALSKAFAATPIPLALVEQKLPTGPELADAIVQYCGRHGLALIAVGKHLFNGTASIARLRRLSRQPQRKTVAKVQAFLAGDPPPGLAVRPAGGPRVADAGGITGAELAARLDELLAEHGLSKCAVGKHLVGQASGVATIRHSNPRRKTVERILAFLANPPIDQLKRRDPWATRRAKGEVIVEVIEPGGCAPPVITHRSAGKPARSFEEQLARVARGEVGIAPNLKFGRPDPSGTLGGVTGEINL